MACVYLASPFLAQLRVKNYRSIQVMRILLSVHNQSSVSVRLINVPRSGADKGGAQAIPRRAAANRVCGGASGVNVGAASAAAPDSCWCV